MSCRFSSLHYAQLHQWRWRFLPNLSNADFSVKVINITLGSQLMTHLSASLWMALAFSFPLIIYLLWGFISPGLYENERRGARKAFLFGNVMFYLGVLVGYFIVFPLALRFLSEYQLSASIENTLTLDSYMDNFYSIIVALGVVFELPLLAWMLGKMGLLKRSFLQKISTPCHCRLGSSISIYNPNQRRIHPCCSVLPSLLLVGI